jgi:hypothetical protein
MMPNGDNNYKNQAAMTARVTTMVARAMVTGSKRVTATMAMMATTATTATTATMATMAMMTPNSNDAASGDKGNEDTKQWQRQQRQRRTMAVIDPEEAQDAAIALMTAPWWRLCHHTVVSHSIDPTGEYIENLDPKSGSPKKTWISWPANRSRFVTKWLKRGRVHNLDSLKKEVLSKNLAKKRKNTQQIELRQAPIITINWIYKLLLEPYYYYYCN